jgi:hypothetical protein
LVGKNKSQKQGASIKNYESIDVSIQWGPREDGLNKCAENLSETLKALAIITPAFSMWGNVPTSSLRKPNYTKNLNWEFLEEVLELLQNGETKKDLHPREIIPSLGFMVLLWNIDSYDVTSFCTIGCNSYAKGLINDITITVKSDERRRIGPDLLVEILKTLIQIWNPEFGSICQNTMGQTPEGQLSKLAFYSRQNAGRHHLWYKVGKAKEILPNGTLWLDESVVDNFTNWDFKPKKMNLLKKFFSK